MKKLITFKEPEVSKTVLVFDICSSSDILEGLKLNDNLRFYNNLLINLKEFIVGASKKHNFDVYKFIGDGWILLFNETDGENVLSFLDSLGEYYDERIKRTILPHLECPPEIMGLTCGIETGVLRKIIMMGKTEYIGRPINVACRLQASVKDDEKTPQYRVLMSSAVYKKMFSRLDLRCRSLKEVHRNLRNINGGKSFRCFCLSMDFIEAEICDKNLQ